MQEPSIYWLASYPKSGNTWLRVFLENLQANQNTPISINSLTINIASDREWVDDIFGAQTSDLTAEEVLHIRPSIYQWRSQNTMATAIVKVHDANLEDSTGRLLYPNDASAGVIYVVRNPLDVAISFAHHVNCSLEIAVASMNNPECKFAKFTGTDGTSQLEQRLSTWSRHIESWVDHKCAKEPLVIRYEDMTGNPLDTFTKVAKYLDFNANSQSIITAIEHSDFKELKSQEEAGKFRERPSMTARFFRNGMVGEWQSVLNTSLIDSIISNHHAMMRRFDYLDENGKPKCH